MAREDTAPPCFAWDGEDLVIRLRVTPRADRNAFGAVRDGRLGLRTTTPPVDGKANATIVKFVAKAFGVPQSQVTLATGARGRNKNLRIARPRKIPAQLADLVSAQPRL